MAEFRRRKITGGLRWGEDEAIARRAERRNEPEWRDSPAALARLRRLASHSGAVISPTAFATASIRSPVIREANFPGGEFAFDMEHEQFAPRRRDGERSAALEIRAGRAVEGVIGPFSPPRFDLQTDMLLRREGERTATIVTDRIDDNHRTITDTAQQVERNDSLQRAEDRDDLNGNNFQWVIKEFKANLGDRDAAPPHLPAQPDQGPDFTDNDPIRRNPLYRLGHLIDVAA